jgi:hypothetical protein
MSLAAGSMGPKVDAACRFVLKQASTPPSASCRSWRSWPASQHDHRRHGKESFTSG